jgi:hypothetical protein
MVKVTVGDEDKIRVQALSFFNRNRIAAKERIDQQLSAVCLNP